MSSSELNRIFSRDDRGYKEAKGILARLYRSIARDLDLGSFEISHHLENFLVDPKSGIIQSPKKRTQARGNYIKKLVAETMSIKSFHDLIKMLKPRGMTITVRLEWEHGDTEHSYHADYSGKPGTQVHLEPDCPDDDVDGL